MDGIVTRQTRAGRDRAYFVADVRAGCDSAEASSAIYASLEELLQQNHMDIVHELILGSLSVRDRVLAARDRTGDPFTYIQGRPVWGEGLAGVLVCAMASSCTVTRLADGSGRTWGGEAPGMVLQNIHGLSPDGDNSPQAQTRRMIQHARKLLTARGSDYSSVSRTWFYLSDILGWYPRFNEARSAEYAAMQIMPTGGDILLPASTGIGGDNPHGAKACMDLMAVTGRDIERLSNPGQKDAFEYGSAFSRAAAVPMSDHTLLQLSGTAAIDEQGRSLYPGDVSSQIEATFDKVEMLIQKRGASLPDACAATAFFKRAEDAPVFDEICQKRGLDRDVCVCVVADVCREELLFELDAEFAWKQG